MIFEAKGQGATVDEALAAAKAALNAPETADVHVEILSAPQKKILGLFGGKKAEARAFYEVPDAPVKQEKPKAPKAQKPQAPKQNEQKQQPAQKQQKQAPSGQKQQPKQQPKAQPAAKAEPDKQAQTEAAALKAAAEEEAQSRTPLNIDEKPGVQAAVTYLKAVLTQMGIEKTEISAFVQADNEVLLELDCGDDYGVVIGRRGETLDAVQYLTRLAANRKKTEGEYSRITLNVGSYREKRRATLSNLAKKNAEKVRKYGRPFTFEPMNPYERRIIHTTVQGIEGVSSHSVGSDEERRVVITLEDGVKPLNPSRGGGRGGRGGRSGGGRSRGGRGGSDRGPQQSAPTRAPKTDAGAAGVSLYGKIN